MAKVYMYKDGLANVYNILGVLSFLMGGSFLLSRSLGMAFAMILAGIVLNRMAACRASKTPLRIKARIAGIMMLVMQVMVIAERVLNGTLTMGLSVSTVISLLVPLFLAVVLLGSFVRNKPIAVVLVLLVYQVLCLIPLLQALRQAELFSLLFSDVITSVILLFTAFLPAIGILILLLRARKMSPEERTLYI